MDAPRQSDMGLFYSILGKNGVMLRCFANGLDLSGVRRYYAVPPIRKAMETTLPVPET